MTYTPEQMREKAKQTESVETDTMLRQGADAIEEVDRIVSIVGDGDGSVDIVRAVEIMAERAVTAEGLLATERAKGQALESKAETLRMQLVACSVASMQNTAKTVEERLDPDHPHYSVAYMDVCRAVDDEIDAREALAAEVAKGQALRDRIMMFIDGPS